MRSIPLQSFYIQWVNAVNLGRGEAGCIPYRFPLHILNAMGDMAPIARMTTSIEIQLQGHITDLEFALRVLDSDGYGIQAELFRGPHKLLPTWTLSPTTPSIQHAKFSIEQSHHLCAEYPLRLLLPTHCTLEIIDITVDDKAVLTDDFQPYDNRMLPDATPFTWLVYGDSLVQGANVSTPSCTWPHLLAIWLKLKSINLGIGGHGCVGAFMADYLASRQDYDLVSVHSGVNALWNMGPAHFCDQLGQFIQRIRESHRTTPILVASPAYCHLDATHDSAIREMRTGMALLCQHQQDTGDTALYYIDGLQLLDAPEYLRADMLHFSDAGAIHYARSLEPHMRRILKRHVDRQTPQLQLLSSQ